MSKERKFYQVGNNPDAAPLRDYLMHGYQEQSDFRAAVRRLTNRWHDRIGEVIDERYGFLLLRFHDTPGSVPDEEWLPMYLLTQVAYELEETPELDETEEEIIKAFGF